MKLSKKILPALATVVLGTTSVFAAGHGSVTVDAGAYDTHKDTLPLSEKYPTLSEYVLDVNQSAEFDGIRFTVEEVLLVDQSIYLTALIQSIDGTPFPTVEYGLGFDRIDIEKVLSAEEQQNEKVYEIVQKLVNSYDMDQLLEIIPMNDLEFLFNNLRIDGYSRGANSGITMIDGSTMRMDMNFDFGTELAGETVKVNVRDLQYWSHNEQQIDVDLSHLIELFEGIDAELEEITNIDSINYVIEDFDGFLINYAGQYIDEEGQNTVKIVSSYNKSNNSGANLHVRNAADGNYIPTHTFSNYLSDETYCDVLEFKVDNIEDIELYISSHTTNVVAQGEATIEVALPAVNTPILSAQNGVNFVNEQGVNVEISSIKVTPMAVELEGQYTGVVEYFTNEIGNMEIVYKDGTTQTLNQHSASGSYQNEGDAEQFYMSLHAGYYNEVIDINNVSGIILHTETINF
ncbi:MAG: hypothetical protein ATN36_08020 [Epulopiscium sp. Nele67-Bin005]|nr:MAG: hypothetical protein ATN36_08020 [Epulopiscium sp. Nele67-Bin005]